MHKSSLVLEKLRENKEQECIHPKQKKYINKTSFCANDTEYYFFLKKE